MLEKKPVEEVFDDPITSQIKDVLVSLVIGVVSLEHIFALKVIDAIWMKICNEKMISSFLLSHHHLLSNCTTNI
jgi:hypothetical protein